jgi:hypothetical protein
MISAFAAGRAILRFFGISRFPVAVKWQIGALLSRRGVPA